MRSPSRFNILVLFVIAAGMLAATGGNAKKNGKTQ